MQFVAGTVLPTDADRRAVVVMWAVYALPAVAQLLLHRSDQHRTTRYGLITPHGVVEEADRVATRQ